MRTAQGGNSASKSTSDSAATAAVRASASHNFMVYVRFDPF